MNGDYLAARTQQMVLTGAFGSYKETQTLTFSATSADQTVFTVTGDIIAQVICVVGTSCFSGGGCEVSLGTAEDVDAMIPVTEVGLLAQREIWHDGSPDSEVEALDVMRSYIISDSNDIVLDVEAGQEIDSGELIFYAFWTPLSSDGNVVPA